MKKTGALVTLVILVVVLAGAWAGRRFLLERQEVVPSDSPATGDTSDVASTSKKDAVMLADHDATVYTDAGEPVALSELADGQPLVINFWATWCPYCVEELPDFQEIVADYEGKVSFAFVDVADGSREKAEDAQSWLVDQGFDDLPAYFDTDLQASMVFGASALPTTAIVSADGEVLSVSAGRIDPILLRGYLNELV